MKKNFSFISSLISLFGLRRTLLHVFLHNLFIAVATHLIITVIHKNCLSVVERNNFELCKLLNINDSLCRLSQLCHLINFLKCNHKQFPPGLRSTAEFILRLNWLQMGSLPTSFLKTCGWSKFNVGASQYRESGDFYVFLLKIGNIVFHCTSFF